MVKLRGLRSILLVVLIAGLGLLVIHLVTAQVIYYTIVMNLLGTSRTWGVPHVYQGDYAGNSLVSYPTPTSQWPVYYSPLNAFNYWSSSQPVLDLVPAQSYVGGAMFWQWNYVGGNVTVYLFGTYSSGTSPVADGFIVYLFLQPTMWSISPGYNYSIQYTSTAAFRGTAYPSINEGDVILPQSSIPYIIVEWESYWQFGYTTSGATGQWNVWIVNNPSGNNPSFSPYPSPNLGSPYAGWGGIGTGAFQPSPGDRIEITITYDPTANVLSGSAYDENTGQSASFTVNLNGYYTPPSIGNYVFGVGAATGGAYANWALMFVDIWGTLPSIPTITATTTVTTTTTVTIPVTTTSTTTATTTSTVTSTVTSLVTSTVTSPVTTTVISTITSPTTTTVTSTVTVTKPLTVTVITTRTVGNHVVANLMQVSLVVLVVAVVLLATVALVLARRR